MIKHYKVFTFHFDDIMSASNMDDTICKCEVVGTINDNTIFYHYLINTDEDFLDNGIYYENDLQVDGHNIQYRANHSTVIFYYTIGNNSYRVEYSYLPIIDSHVLKSLYFYGYGFIQAENIKGN